MEGIFIVLRVTETGEEERLEISIDQWVALAASVGACMSAIAALFVVRQNMKHRELSFQPELAPVRINFSASKNPLSNGSFAEFWVEHKVNEAPDETSILTSLAIPLHNIGLGTAKELTLEWEFPIDDLIESINEKAQKLLIPAYFEIQGEVLSLKSEQLNASTSMWGNQKKETFDYVLPSSIDKHGVNMRVPPAYMELFAALMYFSAKEADYTLSDLPLLSVTLEYYDISGDKHRSSFDIEVQIVVRSAEFFTGYIQSRKSL